MSDNLTVIKNQKEKRAEEKRIIKKIQPKLEKYLIDQQVNKAAETAVKSHEKAVETIQELDKTNADKQAAKIAMSAFLDLKLWEKYPAPLEYAWLTGVRSSDGKRLSPAEVQHEFATDISGFSSYLVTEWMNMKKDIKEGKYPDPMSSNEVTITFFWQKFCADMNILMRSDMKYKSQGNKGVLLPD